MEDELIKQKNKYYVDEAGDLTLFDKKGRIIVGSEGVSKFFMVGVAKIGSYTELELELNQLRHNIIADPYFEGVPSLKSTEKQFHACKDLPEIKREVFKVLIKYDINVYIALKRKDILATFAKQLYDLKKTKISEHDIYDDLIKRVFRNLLHKADNDIYFSRRGKAERTASLENAISKAKSNFEKKYRLPSDKSTKILSKYPYEVTGLQVIDYFLWAVQRMFEKGEDRYVNFLKDKYKLIMDLDDQRRNGYGEWYSKTNPLTIEKIKLLES